MSYRIKRNNWIDTIKGIGIILIVIGHVNAPGLLNKLIYGFHVPLFFVVTGYLYNKEKWEQIGLKKYITTRFKNYIIPYLVMGIINIIVFQLFQVYVKKSTINLWEAMLERFYWLLCTFTGGDKMGVNSPLWFLPCLFISSMLFFIIEKKNSKLLKLIICISLVIINYFIEERQLLWHVNVAMLGTVFMVVGYEIKNSKILEKVGMPLIGIIGLLGIVVIFINGPIDVNKNVIGNPFLFMFGAICVCMLLFYMSFKFWAGGSLLSYIGKNTMIILGFHNALIPIIPIVWNNLPIGNIITYTWWIATVIIMGICLIMIFVLDKMKSILWV